MGKLIPLTACLIFFASSAHAEYVSSPICVFYDSKPEKPYLGFKNQYEIDRYNQEVDSYNDSRSRYIKCGPFKFEVQQYPTDRRIPRAASDNQAIFLGGHLLDPLLLLLAQV